MRSIEWLFLVSALLFTAGIGFVITGAREARSAPPPPTNSGPEIVPVATIKQIMVGITGPSAAAVFSSVGTSVSYDGIKETAPQNDEEWAAVGSHAAALVESGNLMLMSGRLVDKEDWVAMTREFIDKSQLAIKAAADKNTDELLRAGGEIFQTCETCHQRYQM